MPQGSEVSYTASLAKLTALELAGNKIGDVGLSSFAEACAKGALAKLEMQPVYSDVVGR